MIRLFRVRSMDVVVSLPALLPALAAVLLGRTEEMLINILVLVLHESAHTLMAVAVGCTVTAIELQPFGFMARLLSEPPYLGDMAAIAAAGPVFSLLSGMAAMTLFENGLIGGKAVGDFASFSMIIALVNLMPALPLDGGRMLTAALKGRLRPERATRVTAALGFVLGAAVAATALLPDWWESRYVRLMLGVFIVIGAAMELRRNSPSPFADKFRAIRTLERMDVQCVAVSADMPAALALRLGGTGKLTYFYVVDADMRTLGVVSEGDILSAAAAGGSEIKLGQCLLHKSV